MVKISFIIALFLHLCAKKAMINLFVCIFAN